MIARDPSEQLRSEKEIRKIKQYIEEYEDELHGERERKVEEDRTDPIVAPTVRRVNRQWIIGVSIALVLLLLGYCGYQRISAVTPDYSSYLAYVMQGDSLIAENEFIAARTAYEKALEYNPEDEQVQRKIELLNEANSLISNNNNEEAQRNFELILNIPASNGLTTQALEIVRRRSDPSDDEKDEQQNSSASNSDAMQISIKWDGNQLILTITGGRPFGEERPSPYLLSGIDCKDCVDWSRTEKGYQAIVPTDAVSSVEISIRDSAGNVVRQPVDQSANEATAPSKDEGVDIKEQFDGYVEEADDYFEQNKFQKAKDSYTKALALFSNDEHCKKRLAECNKKIAAEEEAAAKNIARRSIPSGSFEMGTASGGSMERPVHTVSLPSFRLSAKEVTVGQYRAFCNFTGAKMPDAPRWGWNDTHPMVNVNWEEALAFCKWVGGRLPTEAEWEYAASEGKGENSHSYSGGNLNQVACYKNNSGGTTRTVGTKKPNKFGLHDMTGNVWEWCADWYGRKYYAESTDKNPKGPNSGTRKVLRGGAYDSDPNAPEGNQLKVTYRNYKSSSTRSPNIGFRVAW